MHGDMCGFFGGPAKEWCGNLTRIILLCLRCTKEGVKKRTKTAFRARISLLCRGGASAAFLQAHADRYMDQCVYCIAGYWLPRGIQLDSPLALISNRRNNGFWQIKKAQEGSNNGWPTSMRKLMKQLGLWLGANSSDEGIATTATLSLSPLEEISPQSDPLGDDFLGEYWSEDLLASPLRRPWEEVESTPAAEMELSLEPATTTKRAKKSSDDAPPKSKNGFNRLWMRQDHKNVADISNRLQRAMGVGDIRMTKKEVLAMAATKMEHNQAIVSALADMFRDEAGDGVAMGTTQILDRLRQLMSHVSGVPNDMFRFIEYDPTPAAILTLEGEFVLLNVALARAWNVDRAMLKGTLISKKFCVESRPKLDAVVNQVVGKREISQIAVECEYTQAHFRSIGSGYELRFVFSPLIDNNDAVAMKVTLIPFMLLN